MPVKNIPVKSRFRKASAFKSMPQQVMKPESTKGCVERHIPAKLVKFSDIESHQSRPGFYFVL